MKRLKKPANMRVCRLFRPCFLQHLFDRIFQNFFILESNALGKNFSVLKKDDRRDRHNSVAGSNITVLVYIEFADLYFSVVLLSELFDHRSHHTARAAPCRKEIHNYRDIGSQNINIKICACKYCFQVIFSFFIFSFCRRPQRSPRQSTS